MTSMINWEYKTKAITARMFNTLLKVNIIDSKGLESWHVNINRFVKKYSSVDWKIKSHRYKR